MSGAAKRVMLCTLVGTSYSTVREITSAVVDDVGE